MDYTPTVTKKDSVSLCVFGAYIPVGEETVLTTQTSTVQTIYKPDEVAFAYEELSKVASIYNSSSFWVQTNFKPGNVKLTQNLKNSQDYVQRNSTQVLIQLILFFMADLVLL
jgi:hypothetical protein